MTTTVLRSKLRPEFWIKGFLFFIAVSILSAVCFYNAFHNKWVFYTNITFWMGCTFSPIAVYVFWKFLFRDLKQLTVTDDRLVVRYLLANRTETFKYSEIRRMTSTRPYSENSTGNYELKIILLDYSQIAFDEDQFSNYYELKQAIYEHMQYED